MRESLGLIASTVGTTGLILRRWCVEELTRVRDVRDTSAIGEQTVVADAVKTIRQDVGEKAADELVDRERHHLGPVTPIGAVVLPFKGHACIGDADQAAIGDCDAVGVARQIGQYRLGSAERAPAVDDPFGVPQCRQISSEGPTLDEAGMIAEECRRPTS